MSLWDTPADPDALEWLAEALDDLTDAELAALAREAIQQAALELRERLKPYQTACSIQPLPPGPWRRLR